MMAGVPSDFSNPLGVIDKLFADNVAANSGAPPPATWGEKEYFVQALGLQDEENFAKIPCLNDMEFSSTAQPFSLVRYRALVQDVFEPELYASIFQESDCHGASEPKPTRLVTSKYRECVDPVPGRRLEDLGPSGFGQRGACYCVPIPGEAPWAKTAAAEWARERGFVSKSSCDAVSRTGASKRGRDDMDLEMEAEVKDTNSVRKTRNAGYDSSIGMQCMECTPSPGVIGGPVAAGGDLRHADEFGLNLPLPAEEQRGSGASMACIVKLYDNEVESVRLCETIEVVGILCINPELASFDSTPLAEAGIGQDARNPSTSLVPRIHAILVRRLPCYNPLLPYSPDWLSEARLAAAYQNRLGAPNALSAAWQAAMALLTCRLAGDELAAQYLLLQLVARSFGKQGDQQLGSWSMVLSRWPEGTAVGDLRDAVAEISPRAVHLQLTAESLNSKRWRPCKDYIANRLVAGQLQLAPGTALLLDETQMAEGQLNPEGVKSLMAVGTLVTEQMLACDFSYDVKVPLELSSTLVTTRRNPLVKDVGISVPIRPNAVAAAKAAAVPHDGHAIEAARFLMALVTRNPRAMHFPEEVTHTFSEDFVRIRQEYKVPPELCHTWLCISRACCLWHGEAALTAERWRSVLAMERERLRRCAEEELVQSATLQ